MRTLRYLVLAMLFLLVVVVIIGFFLPAKVHLERSIVIKRDSSTIFQVINALSNFNKWSPWYALDVNAEYILSGSVKGVGSKISWQGNKNIGKGSNEIIESQTNQYIKTEFFFGKSDQPAYSTLSLSQERDETKVTWAFDNDFGHNVFYRYFGLVIEDMIAPDYERGLQNLKKHVESLPLYDYSNVSITNTQAENIYTYKTKANLQHENITSTIATAYTKLISFFTKNNIEMNGSPKIISLKLTEGTYHFLAAIPVVDNSIIDDKNEIISAKTYQGKAIKLIHRGSYENFKRSYDVLDAFVSQNNYELNGSSWEDFVTDPTEVTQENLVTHIYQPIK